MEKKWEFLNFCFQRVKIDLDYMVLLKRSSFFFPSLSVFLLLALVLSSSCSSKRKISKSSPEFTIIQSAKSYLGTPYLYGGTTRTGIDCSALVLHSFSSVGMALPRRSEDQSEVGKKIKYSKIRPGDVLFFATGKKKKEVTHAGIVTEVDKKDVRFIHASTSLGVTQDYLSSNYWNKAFLFARRFLK